MNNKKSQKGIHDLLLRFPGNLIARENARAETLLLCLRFIWCVGYSDFQVQDETRFVVGHPTTSCLTPYPAAAKCETTLHDQEDIQRLCYVSTLKIQIRECSIVVNADCCQRALFPVPVAVDMVCVGSGEQRDVISKLRWVILPNNNFNTDTSMSLSSIQDLWFHK
jgi:hypothetical protein